VKTLVVGGTGGIGGNIALALRAAGHEVTLAARQRAQADSPVAAMPILLGSFADNDFTRDQLAAFENIVFSACNDPRQLPPGSTPEQEAEFYHRVNSVGVPRFLALAREAGVRRVAYIGSFYPQARPDLIPTSSYIQSRLAADEGARALAGPGFRVLSLNAPWVVGAMPGIVPPVYAAMVRYARGELPGLPVFAIPGGVNFISVRSLTEAVIASFTRGDNGRGYLVGDENLRFRDFFGLFFQAVGRNIDLPVRDEPHPIFVDAALLAGRAGTIFYEPEGAEELGYRRGDVARAVQEMTAATP
jgi:nucleoside-diphosphate-sugar epimerase